MPNMEASAAVKQDPASLLRVDAIWLAREREMNVLLTPHADIAPGDALVVDGMPIPVTAVISEGMPNSPHRRLPGGVVLVRMFDSAARWIAVGSQVRLRKAATAG